MTPTPKAQLQQWFQFLQGFQTACEQVDTDVSYETLLVFANDKIIADLSTTNEQNEFIVAAQKSTGLTITSSDLAASATFEALLETVWNPLSMFVTSFVRSCAPAPFGSMSFTDFLEQPLAAVFPGAKGDANWQQVQNGFVSSIPSACYSPKQQASVNALLTTAKKTIQDVVNLVSKMG
jgi:hypothetical protein